MKNLVVVLVSLISASARADISLGRYETPIKKCDGAVIAALKMPGYSPELEVVLDSAATNQLNDLLKQDILQGLDRSKVIAYGTDSVAESNGTATLSQVTDNDFNAPAATSFTSIVRESTIEKLVSGRGVPDSMIGKVAVSPGYYAFLDGNTLRIRVFRTSNNDLGIPGLLIGEFTVPSCN